MTRSNPKRSTDCCDREQLTRGPLTITMYSITPPPPIREIVTTGRPNSRGAGKTDIKYPTPDR